MRKVKKVIFITLLFANSMLAESLFYIKEGKKVHLEPLKTSSFSFDGKDYYKSENGVVLGVDNSLLVSFKNVQNRLAYMREFHVAKSKHIFGSLYKFTLSNKAQTIATANALSLKKDVKYAHPNFSKKIGLR